MKKSKTTNSKPNHWLMKTEPDVFSIDDLAKSPDQTTGWIGVRNYQARNYMRDQMRLGDRVLVYHSNANPSCVVGSATVVRTAYPDHSAWDPSSPYFDPKSSPDTPRWQMVDIRLETKFPSPQTLAMLREFPKLAEMVLLRKGMRLSIQPVTSIEYQFIVSIASRIPKQQ